MLQGSDSEESSDENGGPEGELINAFRVKDTASIPSLSFSVDSFGSNSSPHGSVNSLSFRSFNNSPSPSIQSEVLDFALNEDDERKERLHLYVFVLRCIAYSFNAKQPTDMARRQAKVTKQNLETIKQRFYAFLTGDTKISSDEAFLNAARAYYDIFLCNDRVLKMVASGGYSANDFREVFKGMIEKRVRSLPEIDGLSKETVLSSWMAKFDAIYRGEEDSKRGTSRIAATASSELILSKEQLYEMFQTILGIKKYEHQILYNACQLDNADEQAACIRRELQGRVKAAQKLRRRLPAFIHKDMEAMYLEEQQTMYTQLLQNLESQPVTKSSSSDSKYRNKKVQHSISMVEVADDTEPSLAKSDVVLSFTIEVIIAEARGIKSLPSKKIVYCTMEVEGGEKLQTGHAEAGNPRWDTQGDFTTCHPRPLVKVKLFSESSSVLALDDKELGRVIIRPSPGGSDVFEWYTLDPSKGWTGKKIELRIAVKMDRPLNLKKCGYIYAQGKNVWKRWKKRFFVLVQVSQVTFAMCSFGEKKSEPSEMMQLDGYTVDYTEAVHDEEHKGGKFFFKAVKEGDQTVFATDEELERQMWVNKLYTATGQSHKPTAPKLSAAAVQGFDNITLRRLEGDSDRARKHGLDESIQADPWDFDHHYLFELLQHMTLSHRLNDSYSCLGWFSPGQVFVLDEYQARYGVRGCHRHLCYLSDLLDRAEAGVMIDPTLLHYSFAFCASHVHGNRPDGIGTITVEEKSRFEDIKDRLWNLLANQITHFRYCFPFGRPEGALKATLSLFERVMMKDISTPVPPDEFRNEIRKCLQQAAFVNYTRLSSYAKIEESSKQEEEPAKRLEDIIHLAELCVDLLQQNDEHHSEALAWVSDLMQEHQEIFWSLYTVDMDEALLAQPPDTWDSFQLFQFLNEYLQSDPNLCGGKFHSHLRDMFAPMIIRYIDLMESSIAQSVHKGFEREHWIAVGDGCSSSEDMFWKLSALQKFVTELNWPEDVFASHLMHRLKLMATDMVQSCVRRTKSKFDSWRQLSRLSMDFFVPSSSCVMLNVISQARVQAQVLCTREEAGQDEKYRYHGDVFSYLKEVQKEMTDDLIFTLNKVVDLLLTRVSRYDQDSVLSPVFALASPGTDIEDSFIRFVRQNLDQLTSQLHDEKVKKRIVKHWFIGMFTKICDWLGERMSVKLHRYQLQALHAISKELPQHFEMQGLSEKVLKGATYHTVHSRLQVEEAMLKDGQITLTDDLVGFQPHSDETDTESSDEEL